MQFIEMAGIFNVPREGSSSIYLVQHPFLWHVINEHPELSAWICLCFWFPPTEVFPHMAAPFSTLSKRVWQKWLTDSFYKCSALNASLCH